MADNVQLAQGPLTVATKGDAANVQHQKVIAEFLTDASIPVSANTADPLPTLDTAGILLLTSILVELRVQNDMLYVLSQPGVESLEDMRSKYQVYPIMP